MRTDEARPWRVLRLGLLGYSVALDLQEALVRSVARGDVPDTLVLCEHPPTVTVGRAAQAGDEPHPELLRSAGIGLHHVSRGGQTTYHGPGQLVGYPIVNLQPRRRSPGGAGGADSVPDLHAYLRGLENALIGVARDLGVRAGAVDGARGVWVDGRKLASLGAAVRGRVSYHGFALNVSCDLAPFGMITPCGQPGCRVTSLSQELGRPVSTAVVGAAVEAVLTDWHRASCGQQPAGTSDEGEPAAWQ